MKIKFIGVGAAFANRDHYQSNLLITSRSGKNLLFDCGGDARFALGECGIDARNLDKIDSVYISHLHADHIGGLEWLAILTYYTPGFRRPKLFIEEDSMGDLWRHSLKGGLERAEGKLLNLSDYFDCKPIIYPGSFIWEEIIFTLVKMLHITNEKRNHYSYGLLIDDPEDEFGPVFISSDTRFEPDLIIDMAQKAGMVFQDCETTRLTNKTGVHAHYEDLRRLPPEIKKKMWLYHFQPNSDYNPKEDGFMGFVDKGQEFNF